MAQPSFESILDAVMQAESGGRRFDERGNLLTSRKGAQGEMQVMPGTSKAPGYGVEPAKEKTPQEIARVGRDYLKAMMDRYGQVDRALVAYNWGPKNADKWIAAGADYGKLPGETRDYVARVRGSLSAQPGAVAQTEAPKPAEAAPVPARAAGAPRMSEAPRTTDLGANYQAALALSFLADEDEKERRDQEYEESQPSIAKQWLERETRKVTPEALMAPRRSPFGPVMAAGGGMIEKLPAPSLVNATLWAETVARDMYPSREENVKRDAARHMLASAILAEKTTPGIAQALGKAYEFKEAPFKTMGHWLGLSEPRPDYPTDTANNALGASMSALARNPQELQRAVRDSIEAGKANLTPDEVPKMGYRDGGDVEAAPTEGKSAKELLQQIARESGSNVESLVRGAVSMVPGTPGELEYFGRKMLNWSFGPGGVKVPEQTQLPTAAQVRAAVPRVTEPTEQAAGMEELGAMMNVNAPRQLAAVPGMAKTMLSELAVGTRPTDPFFAGPAGAQRGAVKPRGGTFATSGSLKEEPISNLDELLGRYQEALRDAFPKNQQEAVDTFVDKKMRRYFTNEYGTGSDPLRNAMRTGELPLHGEDVETFPEYLLAAARNPDAPGHTQARKHLERFYDEKTRLEAKALGNYAPTSAAGREQFDKELAAFRQSQHERMTAEGLPREFQNPLRVDAYDLQDLQRYPALLGTFLRMKAAQEAGTLPSGQAWALQKQQPIYDVNMPSMEFLKPYVVAETLGSLDPNKLKNMSFEQAMIQGTKAMVPRRDYTAAIALAEKGARVPKETLLTFTKPVMSAGKDEWVRLTDTLATQMEGKLMHHSVGSYHTSSSYGHGGSEGFKSGQAQVFSLRNKATAMPEVTLEAEKTDRGLDISQIKGVFNSFPSHKAPEIFKMIDEKPDVFRVADQVYSNTDTGQRLDKSIHVNWQDSFDNWKALQGRGEWVMQDEPSSYFTKYVWQLPQGKAVGGMVERRI